MQDAGRWLFPLILLYTDIYRYQYIYIYTYIGGSCLLLIWPQNTDLFQLPLPAGKHEPSTAAGLLSTTPAKWRCASAELKVTVVVLSFASRIPIPNCRSWKLLVHILRDKIFRHPKSWNNSSGQKQSAFGVTSFIREQNLLRMSHHGWFCNVQAW